MEYTKIFLSKENIIKIKYRKDAILVYTESHIFICEKDSEKDLSNNLVEFILKGKSEKNGN